MSDRLDNIMSVQSFARRYPDLGLTEKALRWQIYRAPDNGLDKHNAVIRIGRRVYLDVSAYRDWFFSHQATNKKAQIG